MPGKKDYQLITDFWGFWKNHGDPPSGGSETEDEWWDKAVDEANVFCDRHERSELSKALVVALLKEWERRAGNS